MELRHYILDFDTDGIATRSGVRSIDLPHRRMLPRINSMFILMYEFERSAISTAYALHEISMRSEVGMKYDWDAPLDPAPRSKNVIVSYSITFIIGAILLILPLIFLA
jgi:hypothetical protein